MAEPNIDKGLYFNMNKTRINENGEEVFGVWEEGFRDPTDHTIHFGEPKSATPAARDRAADAGVSVQEVAGSGKGGKVTAQDVERAAKE